MIRARRTLAVLLLLPGLALVACEDGMGPETDFDPAATAEAMAQMAEATEDMGPALAGMAAAEPLFQGTFMAAVLESGLTLSADGARTLEGLSPEAEVIPGALLGSTFVWDEATGGYVQAEGGAAPADGVRLVYYAVDPFTGQPVSPLNALGYVELRDLSTEAQNEVAVLVVSEAGTSPVTLADYGIVTSFTYTQSSYSAYAASSGYLSNGSAQLNFDFETDVSVASGTMTLTQDYSMDLEGTGIGVSFASTMTGMEQEAGATMTAVATLTNGSEELVLDMTVDGEALDGEMRYQGVVVVQISGTDANPVFTNAAGQALTETEIAELEELWSSIGVLFEVAAGVMILG